MILMKLLKYNRLHFHLHMVLFHILKNAYEFQFNDKTSYVNLRTSFPHSTISLIRSIIEKVIAHI